MSVPSPAGGNTKVCAFCGHNRDYEGGCYGDFMPVSASEWGDVTYVHRLCALWSPQASVRIQWSPTRRSPVSHGVNLSMRHNLLQVTLIVEKGRLSS